MAQADLSLPGDTWLQTVAAGADIAVFAMQAAFAAFGALDARSVLAVLPTFTAVGASGAHGDRCSWCWQGSRCPRGCGLRGCGFTVLAFEDLGAVLTPLSWPMSEIFSDGLGRPFARSASPMTTFAV
ncbi:hypothetical protein ACWDRB_24635 [Nonomuraea sp. NPDC003707]